MFELAGRMYLARGSADEDAEEADKDDDDGWAASALVAVLVEP